MEKRTRGTVLSVKKQWWLKVNKKPIRIGMNDGAVFPHTVKVRYTVGNTDYTRRIWLWAGIIPPSVDETVTVIYREDNPKKIRLERA